MDPSVGEKNDERKNSSFAPDFNKTKTEGTLKLCSSLPSLCDNTICRYISALSTSKGSKKVYFSFSSYSLIFSPDKLFSYCVSSSSSSSSSSSLSSFFLRLHGGCHTNVSFMALIDVCGYHPQWHSKEDGWQPAPRRSFLTKRDSAPPQAVPTSFQC